MTLTEVSKLAKKWVLFVVLGIVFYYFFLLLIIPGAKMVAKVILPDKNPPNTIYGALPALEFTVKQTKTELNPKYILDTRDGKLPTDLPDRLKVYPVKDKVPSFEKGKNAIKTANELGYFEEDLASSLKERIYKWRKADSDGILEIDTNTEAINLYTPLSGKSQYFPRGSLTEARAVNYAKDILERIDRFYDPLYKNGYQKVTLGEFSSSILSETDSIIDAQIARVDFFRSIEDYPILGTNPKAGMIYVFLRRPSSDNRHYNVPILGSYISEIDQETQATYPIIRPTDAWNFIKQNKGALVNVQPENSSLLMPYIPVTVEEVFINKVSLAYYDSPNQQDYLQPVYVFEGKYTTTGTAGGSLTFYYPAISPEYIQKAE